MRLSPLFKLITVFVSAILLALLLWIMIIGSTTPPSIIYPRSVIAAHPASILTDTVVFTYTETFDSPLFNDVFATTADWNISTGHLTLAPLATAAEQSDPAIVMDEASNSYVAWTDTRYGAEDPDIFVQKFDKDGRRLWPQDIRVNSDMGMAEQAYPTILLNKEGKVVVVWLDNRNGVGAVYAQKLDEFSGEKLFLDNGEPRDTLVNDVPNITAAGTLDTALDPETGDVVVVWSSFFGDIYAQRLQPDGSRTWLIDVPVNLTQVGRQFAPAVSVGTDGSIYVVWQHSYNPNTTPTTWREIYAQKLDANGSLQWPNDIPVSNERVLGHLFPFGNPDITIDDSNNNYITWTHEGRIYAQKISPNGQKLWPDELRIDPEQYTGYSSISLFDPSSVLITWDKPPWIASTSRDSYVYAQKISREDGSPLWEIASQVNHEAFPGSSYIPAVAVDNNHVAHILWTDRRKDQGDIHKQSLDLDGKRLWPEAQRINNDRGIFVATPIIDPDVEGNSHFIWGDERVGYENLNVFSQKVNDAGLLQWEHMERLNVHDMELERTLFTKPDMLAINNETQVAVWHNEQNIFARQLSANHAESWATETLVNRDISNVKRFAPTMTSDTEGNFYIAWSDERFRSSSPDIFIQKLAPNGNIIWSQDLRVSQNPITTTKQLDPAILFDEATDTLFVTWRHDFYDDIFLQRLDLNGNQLWPTDLQINSAASDLNAPELSFVSVNGFVYVAWQDARDDAPYIYLQKIALDGTKQWPDDLQLFAGEKPIIAANDDSNLFITWRDWHNGSYDIFAQGIDESGQPHWSEAVRVNSDAGKANQDDPHIAVDNLGNVHVAWVDYRRAKPDIYAQKLSPAGVALWPEDVAVTPELLYPAIAQASSLSIDFTAESISWAKLSVDSAIPNDGAILYELSNDGGNQWQAVTPNKHHDFATTGTDLRWRATLLANSDQTEAPVIDSLQIVYGFGVPPGTLYVLDEHNQPLQGAFIYHNGQLVGETDDEGAFVISELAQGDVLVALEQRYEKPTTRTRHYLDGEEDFAYRVYASNLIVVENDEVEGYRVLNNGETPILRAKGEQPLILFNILVSVEWNADDAYLAMIEEAFRKASSYLYDVSDGQMAFGQIRIYDQAKKWADADFQISTKNTVRPYAFVGGIASEDTAHSIRVGRFWDGASGVSGNWNEANGYRTLIHEFGHYALYLQDEYFIRTFDENGHFSGQVAAACTGLEVVENGLDATNASIMYYQYNASELADGDRWEINCQNTEQGRVNGEPDWQTVVRYYGDEQDEPRWVLQTPTSRGSVMAGPEQFPQDLLPFPEIEIRNEGGNGMPRQLTVLDPDGVPFPNALVALYTTPVSYTVAIDQGLTNLDGEIAVYGAVEGDLIRVAALDGSLSGNVRIDERKAYEITLAATTPSRVNGVTTPYLSVVPGSEGDSLFLEVQGAAAGSSELDAIVIPAAGGGGPQVTALAFSEVREAYVGRVSFAGVGLGSGEVRVLGGAGNQLIRLNSNYNLVAISNSEVNDLASEDGNFQLHVDAGSVLNGADGYATVAPTGFVPSELPDGKVALGNAYEVRLSGAATELEKPGLLTMYYHPEVFGDAEELTMYWWDANQKLWLVVDGVVDSERNSMTSPITSLGVYILGGRVKSGTQIYLPLLRRTTS